ncbi:MAG: hypothetical protein AB7O61_24850 [Acidimicrobiia bacterium]
MHGQPRLPRILDLVERGTFVPLDVTMYRVETPEGNAYVTAAGDVETCTCEAGKHDLRCRHIAAVDMREAQMSAVDRAYERAASSLRALVGLLEDENSDPELLAVVGTACDYFDVADSMRQQEEPETSDRPDVGWCHICNRDIVKGDDHAPGCEHFGYDIHHPEISPLETDR